MKEIKIKKITPLFNHIVTTADEYIEEDATTAGGIIDVSKLRKGFKEYQKVLAVGNDCRSVKAGDYVCINPKYYEKPVKSRQKDENGDNPITSIGYVFPMVQMYDEENIKQDYLYLTERDVEFVIDEYDFE